MALKNIMDDRIGLGRYQFETFIVLSLIGTNDGVQIILNSLLNPVIRALYPQLSPSLISFLASTFFIGVIFGSLTSGHFADKNGRLTLIKTGAFIQILAGMLFYFSNNIVLVYILRFFYGYSFGFCNSIITTMFVEVSPTKYRGKGLILLNFCITFGKLYGLLLGYLFIKKDITQTDWKTMVCCGGAPGILVLLGSIFWLHQSPRFLLSKQRFEEAFVILDKISERNNGEEAIFLSEDDKINIQEEFRVPIEGTVDNSTYSVLFQKHNIKKTLGLASIWFLLNFCYYGQLTIQGLHISNKDNSQTNLTNYMLTVLGQLPSVLISLFLIDRSQFGRKYSILLFYLGSSIFLFAFGLSTLVLLGSVARFFMKDVYQIIDPLITQSYQTSARIKGYGFCAATSRLGAVLMPYVVIPLDLWSQQSVYYLFAILMLLASGIVYSSVEQTMNRSLESKDNNESIKLKVLKQEYQ